MNILFIGDIFGSGGKRVLAEMLKGIRAEYAIDVCVANGENCSGGRGITKNLITKLRRFGVNVVTSGNHIWDNKDGVEAFATEPFLLRPLNYPAGNPGCGSCMYTLEDGRTIGVINLQGRVFMYPIECPLKTGLVEINKLRERTDIELVDFMLRQHLRNWPLPGTSMVKLPPSWVRTPMYRQRTNAFWTRGLPISRTRE